MFWLQSFPPAFGTLFKVIMNSKLSHNARLKKQRNIIYSTRVKAKANKLLYFSTISLFWLVLQSFLKVICMLRSFLNCVFFINQTIRNQKWFIWPQSPSNDFCEMNFYFSADISPGKTHKNYGTVLTFVKYFLFLASHKSVQNAFFSFLSLLNF